MAKNSIESLYISLGLDMSQLKSDFLAADKTVAENMALLNRENNIIKLRMQVDTAGLDPVKDAEQILQTKLAGVNEMLKNQQDRVKLATANWQDLSQHLGYTAKATQQAEANMLRQKLTLQQLEQELKKLTEEQKRYNQSQNQSAGGKAANALQAGRSGISSLASNMSSAMSQIQTATASTSGALDALGTALGTIKSPAGIAVAALATIPVVAIAASNELMKMARPAVEAGDAVYTLSRRMATSTADAASFNRAMKMMGVDTGQILGTLERLDKQVMSAGQGGNQLTHVFKQLGISLQNDDGSLKSHHEQLLELAKGLRTAKEAGVQFDFQNRLTRSGLGDLVVVIEDYEATLDDAKKIVSSGLADPQLAHQVKAQLLMLEEQKKQISGAFGNALLPVVNDLAPKLTESFGKLTTIIKENADTIKFFGEVASQVLSSTLELVVKLADGLGVAATALKDMTKPSEFSGMDNLLAKDKDGKIIHEKIESLEEYKQYLKDQGKDYFTLHPEVPDTEEIRAMAEAMYKKQYEEYLKAYDAQTKAAEAAKEEIDKNSKLNLTEAHSDWFNKLQEEQAKLKPQNINLDDVANIAGSTDNMTAALEKQITKIREWETAQIEAGKKVGASEEELAQVHEVAEERIRKAKEESQKKTEAESQKRIDQYLKEAEQIRESMNEKTLSSYDKQISQIEKWKSAALEKADTAKEVAAIEEDAAAKAAKAYEDEIDRIKNATKSFQDEIYELTHSQYENDMKKLYEKYQKGLSEGVDKNTMDDWFRLKQTEVNDKARYDRNGDYTRGKYQYTPNYEVPDYVMQAREAIGASNNLGLTVRDFTGALKTSGQQVSNSIPQFSMALSQGAQRVDQFNSSLSQTQAQMSKYGVLGNSNAPQWEQVYSATGRAKIGWREATLSSGIKIMENLPGLIAEAEARRQGLSQQQAGDVFTRIMQRQAEMERDDPLGTKYPNQSDPYQLVNEVISQMQTQTESFTELSNVSTQLSEASRNLAEVSTYQDQNDLSQITSALNALKENNNNPININVNIDSPVMTDSEGITVVADAVAEKLSPILERASSGSNNSY